MVACSAPKPKPVENQKPPEEPKKAEPISVATSEGSNDHFSTTNEKLWTVRWKGAEVKAEGQVKVGKMRDVSGDVYERGEIASTFVADFAEADNREERLNLSGNVTLKNGASTLKAQRVVWLSKQKLYRAEGNVTLESKDGFVGPMQSLLATAKLDKIGTSERFFK